MRLEADCSNDLTSATHRLQPASCQAQRAAKKYVQHQGWPHSGEGPGGAGGRGLPLQHVHCGSQAPAPVPLRRAVYRWVVICITIRLRDVKRPAATW